MILGPLLTRSSRIFLSTLFRPQAKFIQLAQAPLQTLGTGTVRFGDLELKDVVYVPVFDFRDIHYEATRVC